jgi:hypothetical protein
MRVLLDECLPERLGKELAPHDVKTVKQAGLAGRKDGALLLGAVGRFDVFLTVDRSLEWQQQVRSLSIAFVVLRARSNSLLSLRPLVPDVLRAMEFVAPGQVIRIGR